MNDIARYLVTGAQGFIGSHVVTEILNTTTAQVLGLGRSPAQPLNGHSGDDADRYRYVRADLAAPESYLHYLEAFRPTHIVHLASGLFGDAPAVLFRTNVNGTLGLLRVLRELEIDSPRVLLGSSGGVYGAQAMQPVAECAEVQPLHYYAVSKVAAEQSARIAAAEFDCDLLIARIFNVVGPGLDERHACSRWLRDLRRLRQRPPCSAVLQVGNLSSTRDFIDVRDVANACVHLLERGQGGETYNVGTGVETRMSDVLEMCRALADPAEQVAIEPGAPRPVDVPRNVADVTRLRALGWHTQYDLAGSLAALDGYYRQQGAC